MPENPKESSRKESEYDYEYEVQQFLAEITRLPTSLRPKGQLSHIERTIAEASGGLKAGKSLDFTYQEGIWKGYKQIGIVIADERVIFSLKCCERVVAQEREGESSNHPGDCTPCGTAQAIGNDVEARVRLEVVG